MGALTPSWAVLEYQLTAYRRTWRASVLSAFLLPLLMLLSFGVGVGAYIEGVQGVAYLEWLVPGLVAVTVLQVAVSESTWPVFSGFEWMKTYSAQVATPLRVGELLAGQLGYILFRALLSGVAFLLVAAGLGAVRSGWALLLPAVLVLFGAAIALPTVAFTASVGSDSSLSVLSRVVVVPMSLFAGVFFPVDSLPAVVRVLAYATPLWHGVELCRGAALGVPPAWSVPGHLCYLAAWAGLGWLVAHRRFRGRLLW